MKIGFNWHKAILPLIVCGFAFVLALSLIDDADFWWHLKCGEMFVREGFIPRSEIFSFTAEGQPWVDGYLPAQALLYLFWWVGGAAGVSLCVAILVAAAYAIALVMSRRRAAGFGIALAVSMPAVFLARVAMIPRPSVMTPILALAALVLLEDNRLRGGRRIYWLIPLTALWANCHPGFFLAPVFTMIYIVGRALAGPLRMGGRSTLMWDSPIRRMALLLATQMLATLVNPYGRKIYYSLAEFTSSAELAGSILEWKPLFSEPGQPAGIIPCFLIVAAIWLACLLWAGRRVHPAHAMLFIFMFFITVYGRRNLILFGPLSIPLIAWTAGFSIDEKSGAHMGAPLQRFRGIFVKLGAGFMVIAGLFMIWFVATNRFYFYTKATRVAGMGVHADVFPEGAAGLLEKEQIKGNILNYYQAGGYLIFHLFPQYRVYMDARFYPYPPRLFGIENDPDWWAKSFRSDRARYDITGVLIPVYPQKTWLVLEVFMNSREWAAVQADGYGALFLARGAGNDDIIARHEIDLRAFPPSLASPPSGREFRLWDKAEYPFGPIRWAMFYDRIGRPDLAAGALTPALTYRPQIEFIVSWRNRLLKKPMNDRPPER